jgi:hypothetical protein
MRVMSPSSNGRATVALYHAKAREMRALADQMGDPSTKNQMIMLALGYDLLAEHLEAAPASEH